MGYDPARFLAPPGDFWTCPVCDLTLKDPVLVCSSSHSACAECAQKLTTAENCPSNDCDAMMSSEKDMIPDTTATRFLRAQKIRCANGEHSGGTCVWVGSVADEPLHSVKCQAAQTTCPHPGCELAVAAINLPAHLRTCPYRLVLCRNTGFPVGKKCNFKGPWNAMDAHFIECAHNPCPQACFGCQYTGTQDQLAYHAPDCAEILARELLELRRLATENVVNATQSQQELPTPPLSQVPSAAQRAVEMVRWSHGVRDAAPRQDKTSSSQSLLDLETPRREQKSDSSEDDSVVDQSSKSPSLRDHEVSHTPLKSGDIDWRLDRSPPTARDAAKRVEQEYSEEEEGEVSSVSDLHMELITDDVDDDDLEGDNSLGAAPIQAFESPSKSNDNVPSSPTVIDSSPLAKYNDTKKAKRLPLLPPPGTSHHASLKFTRSKSSQQTPFSKRVVIESPVNAAEESPKKAKKPSSKPKARLPSPDKGREVSRKDKTGRQPILEYAYEGARDSGMRTLPPPFIQGETAPFPHPRPQPIFPHGIVRSFGPGNSQSGTVGASSSGPGPIRSKMHRRADSVSFPRGQHPYFYGGPHSEPHPSQFMPHRSIYPPRSGRPPHPYGPPGTGSRPVFPNYYPPHIFGAYGPSADGGADFEEEGFEASWDEYSDGMNWMPMYSNPRVSCRQPISSSNQVDTAAYPHMYLSPKRDSTMREGRYQRSWTPPLQDHEAPSTTVLQRQAKRSYNPPPPPPPPSAGGHYGEDIVEARASPSKQAHPKAVPTTSYPDETLRAPKDTAPAILVISAPPRGMPPKFFPPPPPPQSPSKQSFDEWGLGYTPSLLAVPPEAYDRANPRRAQEVRPPFPVVKLATTLREDDRPEPTKRPEEKEEVPFVKARKPGRPKKVVDEALTTKQKHTAGDRSSSPRKPKSRNKGTFALVDNDEMLSKTTLVDQPPVVFDKRATRSGKEFHSARRGDGVGESADGSDSDVPMKAKLSKRTSRKEARLREDSEESEYRGTSTQRAQVASKSVKSTRRIVRKKDLIKLPVDGQKKKPSLVTRAYDGESWQMQAQQSPEGRASSSEQSEQAANDETEQTHLERLASPDRLVLHPREDFSDLGRHQKHASLSLKLAPFVNPPAMMGDTVVPSHTLRNPVLGTGLSVSGMEMGEFVDELMDESVADDGQLQLLEAWIHLGDPDIVGDGQIHA